MKKLILTTILILISTNLVFAKTLVKYYKTTGDIIQTNTVDEMPSPEILADRFKSANTDVILVEGEVDITKQRVDLNKKALISIPQKELNDVKKVNDERQAVEKLIQDELRTQAIETLKTKGKLDAEGKIVK